MKKVETPGRIEIYFAQPTLINSILAAFTGSLRHKKTVLIYKSLQKIKEGWDTKKNKFNFAQPTFINSLLAGATASLWYKKGGLNQYQEKGTCSAYHLGRVQRYKKGFLKTKGCYFKMFSGNFPPFRARGKKIWALTKIKNRKLCKLFLRLTTTKNWKSKVPQP